MKKRMGIGLFLVLVLISAATGCTAVWDTGATEDKKQSGAPPAEEPVEMCIRDRMHSPPSDKRCRRFG